MSLIDKIISDRSGQRYDAQTRKSINWFKERVKAFSSVNRSALLKESRFNPRNAPRPGHMYHFFYDPKHKETLPVYDRFPLAIMVEPLKDGGYFLNLHYLAPKERAVFFQRLLKFRNNDKLDSTTKLQMSYDLLKGASSLKMFAPCFKRYLSSQVKSQFVEIPAEDWEVALFLPTDSFVYKSRQTVWKNSKKNYA